MAQRDWRDWAACSGADPDLFTPTDNQRKASIEADEREAIKIYCSRCPVKDTCLSEAYRLKLHGVAGGHTEDERRRMANAKRARELRERDRLVNDDRTVSQKFADTIKAAHSPTGPNPADPSPEQVAADVKQIDKAFGDET